MTISLWSGRWRGRSPAGDAHTRSRNVISPSGGIMRAKFPSLLTPTEKTASKKDSAD